MGACSEWLRNAFLARVWRLLEFVVTSTTGIVEPVVSRTGATSGTRTDGLAISTNTPLMVPARTDRRTIRRSWGTKYRRLYAMPRDSIAIVHQRRGASAMPRDSIAIVHKRRGTTALVADEAITQPGCPVPAVHPITEVRASAASTPLVEFSKIQTWLETFE